MVPASVLERHIEALRLFRDELVRLLTMIDEGDQERRRRFGPRYLGEPDEIESAEVERHRAHVAELSGSAAIACAEAGVTVIYQDAPIAGGRQTTINPVQSWSYALDGTGHVGVDVVLDSCNQAIGILKTRYEEAHRLERSLAGRVARFIRFPAQVRRAAGFPPKSTAGRVTFSVAVALQTIITTAVGAVVVAVLLRLLHLQV